MGHAYTPGLTATEQTVIRKRRLLPIPGTVLAKAGDRVYAETVVARAELPGKVHVVNVANLLGIAPDETRDYLVKKGGVSRAGRSLRGEQTLHQMVQNRGALPHSRQVGVGLHRHRTGAA